MVYPPFGQVKTNNLANISFFVYSLPIFFFFEMEIKLSNNTFHLTLVAETEKGIFDAILQGEIDFDSEPWPTISNSAKDLVRKMLTQDPKQRITSSQVLGILLPDFIS